MDGYSRIFVALDGSDLQEKVLNRAIRLASDNKAELIIGHIIDSAPLEAAGTYPASLIPNMKEEFLSSIKEALDGAKADSNIPDVKVSIEVGRIREALLEKLIEPNQPDLVISGARGLSALRYAILGSVSTFLIHNVDCDVLIVK